MCRRFGSRFRNEIPRRESFRVPEIVFVPRGHRRVVTSGHRVDEAVPKRLRLALHFGRVTEPAPRPRCFCVPVQHPRAVLVEELVEPGIDLRPLRSARTRFRALLYLGDDGRGQKPFSLLEPRQDRRRRRGLPQFGEDVAIQKKRFHWHGGKGTGPMERNISSAAARSALDSVTFRRRRTTARSGFVAFGCNVVMVACMWANYTLRACGQSLTEQHDLAPRPRSRVPQPKLRSQQHLDFPLPSAS